MTTLQQANEHRRDLRQLTDLAERDLGLLWRRFDTADAAREGLMDVLPGLVTVYGVAAATLAADWYDDVRDAAGVKRRFTAIPAELPATLGADELARWAIGPLFKPEPDWSSALSQTEGGLQRRVANMSRATITGSSVADPSAAGWQRVGSGECAFCSMLIGRGIVYSEASADFSSHDGCSCVAASVWEGQERPVKPYTPSSKNISDKDRARVREYLRTN